MDETKSWLHSSVAASCWLLAWGCAASLGSSAARAQEVPVAPAESEAAQSQAVEAETAVGAPPAVEAAPAAPAPSPPVEVAAPTQAKATASASVTALPDTPTATPTAPAWTPVFTGSYFTRYEMRANYDDMGVSRARFLEGDAFFYRARFAIGTGLIDVGDDLKVALQFSPQATGVFGTLATNGLADANLGLHEGYLRVQGDHVRLDAGRFELNYGDAFIIGNLDWHELARSFDGGRARLSVSPNSAWLDLFVTLLDEGRDPALTGPASKGMGFGDGDLYFYGAYAALGPAIKAGLDLDVYTLGRGWNTQKGLRVDPTNVMSPVYTRRDAREVTLGARVKQKVSIIDYRAEGGVQVGSRPSAPPSAAMMPPGTEQKAVDVLAYQVDAELGLNLAADKLRVGIEGLYASGNDTTTSDKDEGWDELYPTAHKWLGLADIFTIGAVKRTNVISGVGHVTVKPTPKLSIQADGHLFSRPEKVAAPLGGNDGFAGAELDVGAAYALGKGLKLRALYAVFLPGSDFYPVNTASPLGGEVEPIHYAEVELRYDLAP